MGSGAGSTVAELYAAAPAGKPRAARPARATVAPATTAVRGGSQTDAADDGDGDGDSLTLHSVRSGGGGGGNSEDDTASFASAREGLGSASLDGGGSLSLSSGGSWDSSGDDGRRRRRQRRQRRRARPAERGSFSLTPPSTPARRGGYGYFEADGDKGGSVSGSESDSAASSQSSGDSFLGPLNGALRRQQAPLRSWGQWLVSWAAAPADAPRTAAGSDGAAAAATGGGGGGGGKGEEKEAMRDDVSI